MEWAPANRPNAGLFQVHVLALKLQDCNVGLEPLRKHVCGLAWSLVSGLQGLGRRIRSVSLESHLWDELGEPKVH